MIVDWSYNYHANMYQQDAPVETDVKTTTNKTNQPNKQTNK